jgi:hypothetical protein
MWLPVHVNCMPAQLLYPSGNYPGTQWIAGLVGLKASLDVLKRWKSLLLGIKPQIIVTTAWPLCQLSYSGSSSVSTLTAYTLLYPDYALNTTSGVHAAAGFNTHTHTHTHIHTRFHFHQSSEHTGMGYAACHKNKSEWRHLIVTQQTNFPWAQK